MTRRNEESVEFGGGSGLRTRWIHHANGGAGGHAVLGLHMLGLDASSFDRLPTALPDGWDFHAYDQRGHGAAADQPPGDFEAWVRDVEVALERVGEREIHLVGSSMGGAVAASLAARAAPGRIASLTLIATPEVGRSAFAERARAVADGRLAEVTETTLLRWFAHGDDSERIPEARAAIERMSLEGYDASWRALARFPGFEEIAGSLPPTLCLSFALDVSTPPGELDRIAARIREAGGKAVRIDIAGTGHAGLICRPDEVALALARFLAETTRTFT